MLFGLLLKFSPKGGWVSGGERLHGQRNPALQDQEQPLACGDLRADCAYHY